MLEPAPRKTQHLAVVIVHFDTAPAIFASTVQALAASFAALKATRPVLQISVVVVANGALPPSAQALAALGQAPEAVQMLAGQGNVGFAQGNNLGVAALATADTLLLLNPDAVLAPGAVLQALLHLEQEASCVLVAATGVSEQGAPLYLAKRYPSILTLAVRGFAPAKVQRWFRQRLAHYEWRDQYVGQAVLPGAPLASGAAMVLRAADFRAVGGFDPGYFLYFEDYDLSLKLAQRGRIDVLTAFQITHAGGNAAGKSARHIYWFVTSAMRFFRAHGWRWW